MKIELDRADRAARTAPAEAHPANPIDGGPAGSGEGASGMALYSPYQSGFSSPEDRAEAEPLRRLNLRRREG